MRRTGQKVILQIRADSHALPTNRHYLIRAECWRRAFLFAGCESKFGRSVRAGPSARKSDTDSHCRPDCGSEVDPREFA
jgi:hypothetical protein